ncbi:exosortase C-terminal domain/associated protein EpsI [Desulfonatronum thiodismutans]|uniref:exosortase C-terminal domain/associated protein EpsI n=1 Tax=Desulfonatronum thiodismutans TaxID=159290 RepID=UPI0004ABE45D|nr:exosortase C-terminal domain/associated protein EpsI [Desulfonatronum thiodismutans]
MLTTKKFIVAYALMLLGVLYMHVHADTAMPTNKPFTQFPTEHQGWRMVGESTFSDSILNILKPTDILNRSYARPGERPVDLHIGFYDGGKGTGVIHSPKHCLPGGGWYEYSSERVTVDMGADTVNLVQAVYQHGQSKELFLYWFQAKDKSLNSEYALKLAEITNSIFHGRRDTAFIRISTRYEGEPQQALEKAQSFARDFYPVFREFLPS